MGTPNTPGESPTSGGKSTDQGGSSAKAAGSNPTAGEAAGRSADAARAEQARTMLERAGQQGEAASEAVTKAHSTAQPSRQGRPVITGTAAPRGQQAAQPVVPTGPTGPGAMAPATSASAAVKTANGVDAPTSHISRNKAPTTGMPDLSSIPHPSSAPAEAPHELSEGRARPAISVGSRRGRGPLRASMQLRSIDPWSTLKISLLLSIGLFFVWLVAVGIIYLVLDGMGVWDRLNTGVTDLMESTGGATPLIGPGQVFGVAAIIGIINVVLFTAMTTIGAFVYNMSADAVGGVEVTLADRD